MITDSILLSKGHWRHWTYEAFSIGVQAEVGSLPEEKAKCWEPWKQCISTVAWKTFLWEVDHMSKFSLLLLVKKIVKSETSVPFQSCEIGLILIYCGVEGRIYFEYVLFATSS